MKCIYKRTFIGLATISFSCLLGFILSKTVLYFEAPSLATFMSTADSLDFLPHQVNPDQVENEICSKYDNNFSVDYCYSYSDQTDRSYIIVFDTAENAVNVMKIYINACLNIWEFSRSTNVLVVTDSLSFVSATNYDYYVGTGSEDFPFLYM